MRGHENIIRMRQAGKRPSFVFVNDWPCDTNWLETGDQATVCTAGDSISTLDLRFMVGLRVSVSSHCEERAKALYEACKSAGVEVVCGVHLKPEKKPWAQDGWVALWNPHHEVVDHG